MNISAIFWIVVVWAALYLLLSGLGFFILNLFGFRSNKTSFFQAFWIGWSFTIFILQIWSIFFPVGLWAAVLILVLSLTGLFYSGRDNLWDFFAKTGRYWKFALLVFGTAFLLATQAANSPWNYDSGLYHFQTIRWNNSYPAVFGLGNIHGRLAFNSSYHLYAALLEVFRNQSHHLANGLLVMALLSQIFVSCRKIFFNSGTSRLYNMLAAVLMYPVVVNSFEGPNISSPTPDLPIFLLGILVFLQLLSIIEAKADVSELRRELFYLTVLVAVGVTIKFSFLVFGFTSLFVAYFLVRKDTALKELIVKIVLCLGIAFVPWVVRSCILSGYPVYPMTIGALPVDWRIPKASVSNTSNWIYSWARLPDVHWSTVLNNWDWLKPWSKTIMRESKVIFPLILAGMGGFILIVRLFVQKLSQKFESQWLLALVPVLVSLVFWFFTAPDPRFAGAAFWTLGWGVFCIGLKGIRYGSKVFVFVLGFCIMLSMTSLVRNDKQALKVLIKEKDFGQALAQLKFITVNAGNSFAQVKSPPGLEVYKTRSGLAIYTTLTGQDQCFASKLPCTPYPHPDYHLRKAGDLRFGFKVEPFNDEDPIVGSHDHP